MEGDVKQIQYGLLGSSNVQDEKTGKSRWAVAAGGMVKEGLTEMEEPCEGLKDMWVDIKCNFLANLANLL